MNKRCLTFTITQNGKDYSIMVDVEELKELIKKLNFQNADDISIPIEAKDGEELQPIKINISKLFRVIKQVELANPIIPFWLNSYIIDLTRIYSQRHPAKTTGRDDEIEKIWFYLSQKTRNNVFLVGEADVGKTRIANEIVRQIATNECPKEFYDYRVIQINAQELVNKKDSKIYHYIISFVDKFLRNNKNNIVLYIDGIIYWKTEYELIKLLYKVIMAYHIPVLATERTDSFEQYFLSDSAISKYLNYIVIEEPELEELESLLSDHIKHLEQKYKIKISREMIKFAIFTSVLSNTESANPGKAENVLERAFLEAKRKDKSEVGKDNILSCYNSYTKLYNSFSEESKKITAYHEAGHYVVTMFCKNVVDMKIAFVSILPMMDFYGVNWPYHVLGENANYTKEYFIEQIAICFGGRIAEKRKTSKESTGASNDLYQANTIAENMVMVYGFATGNRSYTTLEGYSKKYIISDTKKEEIDKQVQKYVDIGNRLAERIINENIELVTQIAETLLKEEIMTGEELFKIVKEYQQNKTE